MKDEALTKQNEGYRTCEQDNNTRKPTSQSLLQYLYQSNVSLIHWQISCNEALPPRALIAR